MRRSAKTAVTLRQCTRSPPNIEPTPEVQGQHSLEGLAIRGSSHSGAICIFWSCRRAGAIGTIATATAESARRCLLTFPDVPIAGARSRHLAARQLLAAGVDPSLKRGELRRVGSGVG